MTADNPAELPKPAPSTAGMTTKVVKGSIWTLAGQFAPLVASLIATPFVIKFLGTEQYGVFALMNVLLAYVTFADFGMGLASTNLASEAFSNGDPKREGQVVRAAVVIASTTSGLTAIVMTLGARALVVDLLRIPEHLQPVAITGVYITAVTFLVRVLSGIFNTPQLTRLRMDLNSTINGFFSLLQIAGVPILLYFGAGLEGAFLFVMFSAVGCLAAHVLVSRWLLNQLFEMDLGRGVFTPLFRSGFMIFIALTAGVVLANLEKFALTRYASVADLAYYSVAFTVANMVTLFSASLTQTLIPAFSRMYSSGDLQELKDLYARTIMMNLVIYAPAALLLCLFAKPFFSLWAGPEFGAQSTAPFYVLLLGLAFSFSASISGAMIVATRTVGRSAIMYWLELIPYIALVVTLTGRWGAVGAAVAWSVRLAFESVVLALIVRKVTGIRSVFSERRFLYLSVAGVPLFVAALLAITDSISPWGTGLITILSLTIFAVIVWRRIILNEERAFLLRISGLAPVFRR